MNYDTSLENFLAQIDAWSDCAIDLETTGLDPYQHEITVFACYFDKKHCYTITGDDLTDPRFVAAVRSLCADPLTQKYFHNAKFDMKFLMHHCGCEFSNTDCTYIMNKLLVAGTRKKSDLETLSLELLGITLDKSVRKEFISNKLLTKDMLSYAAMDVYATYHLYYVLRPLIEKERLHLVYDKIERPLTQVIARMELDGIRVDVDYLKKLQNILEPKILAHTTVLNQYLLDNKLMPKEEVKLKKSEMTAYHIANDITHVIRYRTECNISSPKQVLYVLQNAGLAITSTNAKTLEQPTYNDFSLDSSILVKNGMSRDEALQSALMIISMIKTIRAATTALSRFVEPLQNEFINPVSGYVHTSFNQLGTDTGRYSSSEPNLQNMPTENKAWVTNDLKFRTAFIPRDGYQFIVYDYAACELRILAEFSQDPGMIKAMTYDDPHRGNATVAYDCAYEDVTKEQRSRVKNGMFGWVYGAGPVTLSSTMNITVGAARDFMEFMKQKFPGVTTWMTRRQKFAETRLHSITMSGRKRYYEIPRFGTKDEIRQTTAYIRRCGGNSPIQGTNADITKLAQVMLFEELKKFNARQILCIHDEIVIECPTENVSACFPRVGEVMLEAERTFLKTVESRVTGTFGDRWEH